MNPLIISIARIAGVAVLTAVGGGLILERLRPSSSDLVAGAIHFRNGLNEFQKGVTTIFFGSATPSAEEAARRKEAARIPID